MTSPPSGLAAELVATLQLHPHPEGGYYRETFRSAHSVLSAPTHWWQAAEPMGAYALVGATVGPGFDFADFAFLRGDGDATAAIGRLQPDLLRLL